MSAHSAESVYVVVDVGCLECGISTELVGVYESEGAARAKYLALVDSLDADDWGEYSSGQHRLLVLEGAMRRDEL